MSPALASRAGVLAARSHLGTVTAFDEDAGLGLLSDGEQDYPFHCTAIADGTRSIPVGTAVYFSLRPAVAGRLEAADLVPAPPITDR